MKKRCIASILALMVLCTSIKMDAFALSDTYNPDNYIVDKSEAYGGDYLVITNTAQSGNSQSTGILPAVNASMLSNMLPGEISEEEAELFEEYSGSDEVYGFDAGGRPLIDPATVLPEVTFELANGSDGSGGQAYSRAVAEPADYNVGDTKTLYLMTSRYDQGVYETPCVCVSVGEYCTVWIPVDDACYKNKPEEMVAAMDVVAAEFDDKYPKMVNMFGDKDIADAVGCGDGDGKTAIICYDIFSDHVSNTSGGYVGGYFYALDLARYRNGTGNNMDCIHIDSYQGMRRPAQDSITTDYISNCYSTLVHELQHMINHSYMIEKNLESVGTPEYLNEMFSLASEYMMYGAQYSRTSYYNYYSTFTNGLSILNWGYSGDTLMEYSVGYLLGQYIRTQYKGVVTSDGSTIYRDSMEEMSTSNYDLLGIIANKIGMSKEDILLNFRAALELKNPTGPYGFGGEEEFTYYIEPHIFMPSSGQAEYSLEPGGSIVVPNTGEFVPGGAGNDIKFLGLDMTNKETSITINITGDNVISQPQGQIELAAEVTPAYLSQDVVYSIVSGSEYATLDGNILSAVADGNVVVRAAWAEKEEVYKDFEVTILRQSKMPVTVTEIPVLGGKRIVCLPQEPENAVIYYTIDGTEPTVTSEVMPEEGIVFDKKGSYMLKAYAHVTGASSFSDSEVISVPVEVEKALKPEFIYEEQADGSLIVTITESNENLAEIYYTIDGTDPAIRETLKYTQPIKIAESGTYTFKAISVCEGKAASEVSTDTKEIIIEVSDIVLSEENVILYTNVDSKKSAQLVATIKPDIFSGQNVEWSSSSDTVMVGDDGTITAMKSGNALIYAKKGNVTAVCNVEVRTAVERVELETGSYQINKDQGIYQLNAQVYPADANIGDVEYIIDQSDREGDEKGIAVIDGNGKITAVRDGVVKVTVRSKTTDLLDVQEQIVYVTISNQKNYSNTYMPRISSTNITVNKKMTEPAELQLLPIGETEVVTAMVNSEKYASYVEVVKQQEANQWGIVLTEEGRRKLSNGTHWIPITVKAQVHYQDAMNAYDYEDEFAYTIRMKVTNKEPSISISKITINPYQVRNEYDLAVKSNIGNVSVLGLEDNERAPGFTDNFELSEDGTRLIRKKDVADFTKYMGRPVVSGYLRVQVSGYEEQLIRISTSITYQMPNITANMEKRALNYEKLLQNNVISFGLIQESKLTKSKITGIQSLVLNEEDSDYDKWGNLVSISVEDDIVSVSFDTNDLKVGTYRIPMRLTTDEYVDMPLEISFIVQRQTTQPKLTLTSTNMQLNAKYPEETDSISISSISQANVKLSDIQIIPAEKTLFANKDEAVSLIYDAERQCLTASIDGQITDCYTYRFLCRPQYANLESDQVITVTVKVYEKEASVKVITTGQINVLERDTGYVQGRLFPCDFNTKMTEVALTAPKKINGHIYDGSNVFTLTFDEKSNSVKIKAKDDAILLKGKSYAVRLQVTNENDVKILSEDIVIKPYQPSVCFSISRTPVFYRYVSVANNVQNVDIYSTRGNIGTVNVDASSNTNIPNGFSIVVEEDANGNRLLKSIVFDGMQSIDTEPGSYWYTMAVTMDGQLLELDANGEPYAKPYTCRIKCTIH